MVGVTSDGCGAAKVHPSGVLLAVQVVGIVIYPFMDEGGLEHTPSSLIGLRMHCFKQPSHQGGGLRWLDR
jgi:hypothetical protein